MIFYALITCFVTLFLQASIESLYHEDQVTSIQELIQQTLLPQELVELTFFSRYLSLHDQLNNRAICKNIKNHTFEDQTKRDIEYWIKNSYHITYYNRVIPKGEFDLFFFPGSLHQQASDVYALQEYIDHKRRFKLIENIDLKERKNPPLIGLNYSTLFKISEFEAYSFLNFLERNYPHAKIDDKQIILDDQIYTHYLVNKHQKVDITKKINKFLSFLLSSDQNFQTYIDALKVFKYQGHIISEQCKKICLEYITYTVSARTNMLNTLKDNMDVFYELFYRHILDKYVLNKGYYKPGFFPGNYYHSKPFHTLFSEFFKRNENCKNIIECIKIGPKFKDIQQKIAIELLHYKSVDFLEWGIQILDCHSFFTADRLLGKTLIEQIYEKKKNVLQEFLSQQDEEHLGSISDIFFVTNHQSCKKS